MRAILSTARALSEHYVPFKTLFIEEMLQSCDRGGGGFNWDSFDVPMTPAARFVGNYKSICFLVS